MYYVVKLHNKSVHIVERRPVTSNYVTCWDLNRAMTVAASLLTF